jgi:subfamily B ATP-binding cassette protein MsbA
LASLVTTLILACEWLAESTIIHHSNPTTMTQSQNSIAPVHPLRTLLPFLYPFRYGLGAAAVAMVLDSLFTALRPWPLKVVIDRVINNEPTKVPLFSDWINSPERDPMTILYLCCLATILIAVGTGGFTYWFTRQMGNISQRLVFNLRSELFARLQRLSLRYHKSKQLGDTIARLTTDIDAIQMLLARGSLMFFSNFFLTIAMLGMMFWLNWKFTLIACSVAPILFAAVWYHTREIKRSSRRARDHDGVLASLAQESLSAIHLVKGMSQEERQHKKFFAQGERSLKEYLSRVKFQARMAPIVDILAAIGLMLVMYFGAQSVLDKSMTVGDVVIFFAYVTNFFGPMRAMARQAGGFAKAFAGAERVAEVLQSKIDVVDAPDAVEAPKFEGRIELSNVWFQYDQQPTLQGLDLKIEPGEMVAIVGPTGAGKSTVASLLLRLYDPQSGAVKIDGVDIRKYKTDSMRKQIGLVLQDAVMLRGSIRDNILFGCSHEATEAEIQQAADLALVSEFAERMEDGLDSAIAERGATLSGGQRQRIALARMILRKAPILLLDEPTSSLDLNSEAVVLRAIQAAAKGRTTVVITHRLSITRQVDRIVVLADGKVAEQGTYESLLKQNGLFAELVAKDSYAEIFK